MPRAFVLLGFVLLSCIGTGIISPKLHIWTEIPQQPEDPLKVFCSFARQNEHIVQVNWRWQEWNETPITIAVFNPRIGVFIPSKYKEILQLHTESDNVISISLSKRNKTEKNSTCCCKFIIFPDGSLEACIRVPVTAPEGLVSSRFALRPDVLGTLLVGTFSLLGIIALLFLILRKRVRNLRNLHQTPGHQGIEMVTKTPQVQGNSLSSLQMNNLDCFPSISRYKFAMGGVKGSRPPSDFVSMENRLYYEARAEAARRLENMEEQQPGT